MTASSTPPIHVLRAILRHAKASPTQRVLLSKANKLATSVTGASDGGSTAGNVSLGLREHVLEQYRMNMSVPPKKQEALRKLAYDYLVLKNDLTERAVLHELDGGAEVKLSPAEMTRRSAARAGFQLPTMDD